MLDSALFVNETIHEREITLADGAKHTVWFKAAKNDLLVRAQTQSSDPLKQLEAVDRLLVLSVCNPDGTPALTAETVKNLYHGVRLAMTVAIADVNQMGSQVESFAARDDGEWFYHTLVLAGVGGWTVEEAKGRLSAPEYDAWRQYFRLFPFDDVHRYYRPAAVIAHCSGGKDTFDKVMDFLSPEPIPPGMSQADWNTMKAFRSMGVAPPKKKAE